MSADPPWLDLRDGLDLGYVTDLHTLLRAIDEAMPKDATLVLEGGIIAPEIASFVEARRPAERPETRPNTIWPKPSFFHLPLVGTNLAELRALAEGFDDPEVADHFVVYRGREALLWAHDAGYGHVVVSKSLDAGTVERLRTALAGAVRSE